MKSSNIGPKKLLFKVLIVCALFMVGYLGRGWIEKEVDRDKRFVELWESYCVPLYSGAPKGNLDDLVELPALANQWADPKSKLKVEITDSDCYVSDHLSLLTQRERTKLRSAINEFIARSTWEFYPYPQFGLSLSSWDLAVAWTDHPSGTKNSRVTIMLSRFASGGEDAYTTLSATIVD